MTAFKATLTIGLIPLLCYASLAPIPAALAENNAVAGSSMVRSRSTARSAASPESPTTPPTNFTPQTFAPWPSTPGTSTPGPIAPNTPSTPSTTPFSETPNLNPTPDSVGPMPPPLESYKIADGDQIQLIIASVPEFSGVYQIMEDGTATLPEIGVIYLRGLTTPEASQKVAQAYTDSQIIIQPLVSIMLSKISLVDVAITGEVKRPGAYIITPQNGELPTLTEIIEQAGGITQQADLKKIQIRRRLGTGQEELIEANLWDLLAKGDIHQNVSLRDGDSILLPTAVSIPTDMAYQTAQANLSPEDVQVNLVGEVNAPGVIAVPPNTPLNEALLIAGGFTGRARKGSVELLRLNPNGSVTHRRIEIDLDQGINEETNPILHNRDVVLIGRSTLARISDTLNSILSPLGSAFSLFNLFSPFFAPGP